MNDSSKQAYLLRLIEYTLEISKRWWWEFPKDLPEELLWVDSGASLPVALSGAASPRIEASRAVRIILLPLHLVTQHLPERPKNQVPLSVPEPRTRTRVHAKYRQGYYSNIKFPGFDKYTVVMQKSVLVLRKYTLEDWRIKRDVCDLLPNGWGDAHTERADMRYSTYPEPLRHSKSGEVTMEWLSSRLQVRALFLWLYFKFLKAAFYFYNPRQPHEIVMP